MPKFALDTNIYIDAFRDPAELQALNDFQFRYAPFLYMTAVVAEELLAGVHGTRDARAIQKNILAPCERARRVLVPGYDAWKQAGRIRMALGATGRGEIRSSLVNDVILAVTCRITGVVLITRNANDFSAIRRVYPSFNFVAPWP